MGKVFPLAKKNSEKFDISRFGLTLAALAVLGVLTWLGGGGQGSRWWNFFGCFLSWLAVVFTAVNAGEEWNLLLDTYKERILKWFSTLLGLAGYTLGFIHNLAYTALYNRSHYDFGEEAENAFISLGLLWQRSPLEAIIFVGAAIIFAASFLGVLRAIAKGYKNRKYQIKHAPLVEGPDGQKYRVPLDRDTAFDLLEKVVDDNSIPFKLLQERVGDLMYEDFKTGGWNVDKPTGMDMEEFEKKKKFLWVQKVSIMYAKAIQFWLLDHQRYDKAKRDADRLMEIAMERSVKDGGVTTLHLALELHRLVYAGLSNSEKESVVEAKYEKLWQKEKADYDAYVKAAPARQAEMEKLRKELEVEAEYQEAKRQIRERELAEKEAKLRAEYNAKVQSLDDRERTLNAFMDGNTYTNEENYLAGNLGEQEYARRKFLRDEKEDKYRREYEESLGLLDDEDDD
ncbi:unknown [Clostridium sp. CAG:1013]|nr:unknown [Clostridium sp. CAG:1013]